MIETVCRRTPSNSDRNSWVSRNSSFPARSWAINSQRDIRSSAACSVLHAPVWFAQRRRYSV
jgi:hypothetical protein